MKIHHETYSEINFFFNPLVNMYKNLWKIKKPGNYGKEKNFFFYILEALFYLLGGCCNRGLTKFNHQKYGDINLYTLW